MNTISLARLWSKADTPTQAANVMVGYLYEETQANKGLLNDLKWLGQHIKEADKLYTDWLESRFNKTEAEPHKNKYLDMADFLWDYSNRIAKSESKQKELDLMLKIAIGTELKK